MGRPWPRIIPSSSPLEVGVGQDTAWQDLEVHSDTRVCKAIHTHTGPCTPAQSHMRAYHTYHTYTSVRVHT